MNKKNDRQQTLQQSQKCESQSAIDAYVTCILDEETNKRNDKKTVAFKNSTLYTVVVFGKRL